MTTHEAWMRLALEEAQLALAEGEIPVGAVLVREGKLLCRTHNLREQTGDPTAHAEILCMREGGEISRCELREALLEAAPPTNLDESDGLFRKCEYRDAAGALVQGNDVTI